MRDAVWAPKANIRALRQAVPAGVPGLPGVASDVSMAHLHSLGKGANKTRRIASLLISPRSDETGLPPPHGPSGRFAARME